MTGLLLGPGGEEMDEDVGDPSGRTDPRPPVSNRRTDGRLEYGLPGPPRLDLRYQTGLATEPGDRRATGRLRERTGGSIRLGADCSSDGAAGRGHCSLSATNLRTISQVGSPGSYPKSSSGGWNATGSTARILSLSRSSAPDSYAESAGSDPRS